MTDFNELSAFRLSKGSHKDASKGVCAMEAVAWLEGLPHSDRPKCTCPVIAAYVRTLNDRLSNDERQRLVPYLPRLVGTVDKSSEKARAEYLAWQAITVFAPMELEASGLNSEAETLRRFDRARGLEAASNAAARIAKSANADGIYDAARAAADAAAYIVADAAAVDAARAATYTVNKADSAFDALDGVLAIGKQSEPFTSNIKLRVQEYQSLQIKRDRISEAKMELDLLPIGSVELMGKD